MSGLGELAAQFIDQVEEVYGDGAEVEDALFIASIRHGEGGERQDVSLRCTSDSAIVQLGLARWAVDTVLHKGPS